MSHNDNGMLNMSGLVQHLEDILPIDEDGLYDVIIYDAIYSENSSVIWSTKVPNNSSDTYKKFKLRLKSCRQPHELHYGSFFNYFHLFRKKNTQTRIYRNAEKAYRIGIVVFFLAQLLCVLERKLRQLFFQQQPSNFGPISSP